MSQIHETILPLIQVCRHLETCNAKETAEFSGKLFEILLQHDILFQNKNMIQKLLCSIHSMLPNGIFDEISQSLLKKPEQIKDSISINSQVDINQTRRSNIIEMSNDLLINTFQYLDINDLYQVDKTCRLFCGISHDPNSLYSLCFAFENEPNYRKFAHFNHVRYSRIKSLHCQSHEREQDYIDNVMHLLPTFNNLKLVHFDNITQGDFNIFNEFNNFTIFSSLEFIQLNYVNGASVLDVIVKCDNLKTLILADIFPQFPDSQLSKKINEWDSKQKRQPFPDLKKLTIDRHSTQSKAVQLFIYWILAHGHCQKTFVVLDHHDIDNNVSGDYWTSEDIFDANTSDEFVHNLQNVALMNICELVLGIYDFNLINNISKWIDICNKIKFTRFIVNCINVYPFGMAGKTSTEWIQPLHNIVSVSQRSSFCWFPTYVYITQYVEDYVEWIRFIGINYDDHKWIIHDWPLQMLSSTSSDALFDDITLALPLGPEYSTPCRLFELAIKHWLKLKQSAKVKGSVKYKYFCKYKKHVMDLRHLCCDNDEEITTEYDVISKRLKIQFIL